MVSARSTIPLPQMIDDEYLQRDGDGHQPTNQHSQIGGFIYSRKLFNILDDILSAFYVEKNAMFFQADTSDKAPYRELDTVMRLNSALNDFQDQLPRYLDIGCHLDNTASVDPVSEAVALGAKILYSRLVTSSVAPYCSVGAILTVLSDLKIPLYSHLSSPACSAP